MGIGFTGSRAGMTEAQKKEFINQLDSYPDEMIFTHGDCIGADTGAHNIAYSLGFEIKILPCYLWRQCSFCKGGKVIAKAIGPLERNKLIVEDSEIMLACPKEFTEQLRSGTWATIRCAKKANRNLTIIYPDGSIQEFNKHS